MNSKQKYSVLALRFFLAWIFLWAFFDKVFGLGFATESGKAWVNGVSPTSGFLEFATSGPFAGLFQAMAGQLVVDLLFMGGLFGVGLSLVLGRQLKWAAHAGSLMMLLMWLSLLPTENNPFMDEHWVYIAALQVVAAFGISKKGN